MFETPMEPTWNLHEIYIKIHGTNFNQHEIEEMKHWHAGFSIAIPPWNLHENDIGQSTKNSDLYFQLTKSKNSKSQQIRETQFIETNSSVVLSLDWCRCHGGSM